MSLSFGFETVSKGTPFFDVIANSKIAFGNYSSHSRQRFAKALRQSSLFQSKDGAFCVTHNLLLGDFECDVSSS